MFTKSAEYYDEIYSAMGKDYSAEANKAHEFIQKYKQSEGNTLLDVACGTGIHADLLTKHYKVEGVDINPDMLSVARKRHPKIRFHQGDMTKFKLGQHFDVIVCLFSSIGYLKTKSKLNQAIKTMEGHLLPGGVLLVEPWFTPTQWKPGRAFTVEVKKPNLQIVRMSYGGKRGRISSLEFQYLIGTPKGIDHIVEYDEFGLFTHKEYMDAFKKAGLNVTHDPEGLDGRGLYIGTKSVK